MTSISDKLRSLGVKVGAHDLPSPARPRNPYTIEQVIPGRLYPTVNGEVYTAEEFYPAEYRHGHIGLRLENSLGVIAEWAGFGNIRDLPLNNLAYLDIETTGLMGGTGTYAFLVGIGRFEGEVFHLAQFFMRDPVEEPAQLLAIEEFLAPCQAVVSYNGKAFDVPILNTRYLTHQWKPPLASVAQIDLLHLARRIWKELLPSRTLGNVETAILGVRRTAEDVPGWMIPTLFFEYLRSGDARPLKNIFYHNAMDILALAALLNYTASLIEDPLRMSKTPGLELVGTGKLFEDLGYTEQACQIYNLCLEKELPSELRWETLQRLSFLRKRLGDLASAVSLWKQAARQNQIYAHIELAKYYEHHMRDYEEAARWTRAALDIIASTEQPAASHSEWRGDLEHRLRRLLRKLGA